MGYGPFFVLDLIELTAQEALIARLAARDGLSNPRSPPACSSARAPSSTTCARSSSSSTSARETSWTASSPPTRPPPPCSDSHCPLADASAIRANDTRGSALVLHADRDAVPDHRGVVDPIRRERGAGRSRPLAEPVAGESAGVRPDVGAALRAHASGGDRPPGLRWFPARRCADVAAGDGRVRHPRRRHVRAREPARHRSRRRYRGVALRRGPASGPAAQPRRRERRHGLSAPARRTREGLGRSPRPRCLPQRPTRGRSSQAH